MNKNEFLQKLKEDLSSLTDEERASALKYYEEYFADAAGDSEDNAEEKIISEFVSPENLADKIKEELNDTETKEENILKNENIKPEIDFNNYTYETVSNNYNDSTVPNNQNNQNDFNNSKKHYKSSSNNTFKIILLICTAPFWLPLALGLAGVVFGLVMTILGVAFAVAAIAIAGFVMAGSGALSIGYGITTMFVNVFQGFYPIGAGLICLGLGIIIAYAFTKLAVVIFKSQFKFVLFIIRSITGKLSRQGA